MNRTDELRQEYEDLMKQGRAYAAHVVLAERDRLLYPPTGHDCPLGARSLPVGVQLGWHSCSACGARYRT